MDLKNKKVLLVEDDTLIGEMLKRRLKIAGAEVIFCSNGKEAVDIVKDSGCDVIVTDLMMPVLDGHEMLKIIKGDEKTKNIPFLMLTNRSVREEEVIAMKEMGLDDYMVKSDSDLSDIVNKIKDLVKK